MQVFLGELVVPYIMYSLMGFIPERIITGVPEIVCCVLIFSQTAVCILAQMRFLLPLLLHKAATQSVDNVAA